MKRQRDERRQMRKHRATKSKQDAEPLAYGQGPFWHVNPPNTERSRSQRNNAVMCATVLSGEWGRVVNYQTACRSYFQSGTCSRRNCRFFHAAPSQVVAGGTGPSTTILGNGDSQVKASMRKALGRMRREDQDHWAERFDRQRMELEEHAHRTREEEARMRNLLQVAREAELAVARVQALPRFEVTSGADPDELLSQIRRINREVDSQPHLQRLLQADAGLRNVGVLTGKAREFRSHTAPGQLGPYHVDQASAGPNAALLSLQSRARALAPADRCHYWNCQHSYADIRGGGSWVCPLCVCHVFCSSDCGFRAGHPGDSIQCAPHRGWVGDWC